MDVDAERIHVGQPRLRRPLRAGREHLSPIPDDGALLAARVLLAPERVPVAALLGGLPEALRGQMGVDVDAPHRCLLYLLSCLPCPHASRPSG